MKNNVIDIIQRFQTRHALQEERELKNLISTVFRLLSFGSNGSSNGSQLLAKPRLRRFLSESRMPGHEIREGFELARRFDRPQTRYPLRHFRQSARDGEHQVGLRNRQHGRNKERNSERDVAL